MSETMKENADEEDIGKPTEKTCTECIKPAVFYLKGRYLCRRCFEGINKESILDEAKRIIEGVKRSDYGDPKEFSKYLAQLWNVYLQGKEIEPKDTSCMLILLKIARQKNKHKRDNIVDIAGYAAVLAMVEDEE